MPHVSRNLTDLSWLNALTVEALLTELSFPVSKCCRHEEGHALADIFKNVTTYRNYSMWRSGNLCLCCFHFSTIFPVMFAFVKERQSKTFFCQTLLLTLSQSQYDTLNTQLNSSNTRNTLNSQFHIIFSTSSKHKSFMKLSSTL